MDEKVNIPVGVDTRKAKSDLAQLNREKARTGKRINAAARRTSRVATRAFAFTGVAATIGKFQSNESSGNVNPVDEALTPLRAAGQQFIDDGLGFSAKARKSAREQTKAAFAYQVGRTGDTAGMRDFYNTASKIQQDVESGRNLIRRDPRFVGPDPMAAGKAAVKGHLKLFFKNLEAANPMRTLMRGFEYVAEGIAAE
ncbi:MAG: hypothetical protein GY882_12030 [Actinomycetia bacterium]|nr:hypothetical protein [Actinomycetes bacterium]